MAQPVGRHEWRSHELHEHQLDLAGGDPRHFTIAKPRLREAVETWWADQGRAAVAHPSVAGTAGFRSDPAVSNGTMLARRLFLTVFRVDGVASLVLDARPVRVERGESGRVQTPTFREQAFVVKAFEGVLHWASLTPKGNFFLRSSDLPRDFIGPGHDRQVLAVDPTTLVDPTVRWAVRRHHAP